MASYTVNEEAVHKAERLIRARQYVLDSDWGQVQPDATAENAFLAKHSWDDYAAWHLGLTEGANDETKARYAFVVGDFRRIHRSALIACVYRAAEWRHKKVELAAHRLLQLLDELAGVDRPATEVRTPGCWPHAVASGAAFTRGQASRGQTGCARTA